MKFRILEIKEPHMQLKYRPQYKNNGWFSMWRNISDTKFAGTIFCHVDFSSYDNTSVWNQSDAHKIIEEFKSYLQYNQPYVKIHAV